MAVPDLDRWWWWCAVCRLVLASIVLLWLDRQVLPWGLLVWPAFIPRFGGVGMGGSGRKLQSSTGVDAGGDGALGRRYPS
jgi:hypothetical protein